jgi:hypothetical protein
MQKGREGEAGAAVNMPPLHADATDLELEPPPEIALSKLQQQALQVGAPCTKHTP